MGFDYFVFYTEASVVCIVILAMLLINDRLNSTRQEKQVWFDRAIVAFMLYFASDAGWAAVLSGQLPRTRALVILFNFSNYVLMSVMAYEWFMFMAASEKMAFRNDRKKRLWCLLPMAASVLFIAIAYAAAPTFWISESGDLNTLYYPLLIAAPVFYLLTAFVLSLINARNAKTDEEEKQCRLIGIFPLGVMLSGIFQLVVLNAPVFCFGCTLMMLFFYIQNMQLMISVDDLTRLNNRGQINRFMEQLHYRESVRVFIMMIDIDNFKQINDTFGHAEGDRALRLVAEALKQTCDHLKCPVFLGRYGGDEFTVIFQNPQEGETPEQIAAAIRAALAEKRQENQLRYPLDASVGCDELRDKSDTMQACMDRADEKLYQDKRSRGAGR